MRRNTCLNSSASWVERMMRSSVWQLLQSSTKRFWSSVPGMLISHSALDICAPRFCVGLSLTSILSSCPAADGGVLGTVEIVADGANADRIMPGIEARSREAEMAFVVADDRDGDGRAVLPGADDDAFHQAFFGGADLARKRGGGLREGRRGGLQRERRQSRRRNASNSALHRHGILHRNLPGADSARRLAPRPSGFIIRP